MTDMCVVVHLVQPCTVATTFMRWGLRSGPPRTAFPTIVRTQPIRYQPTVMSGYVQQIGGRDQYKCILCNITISGWDQKELHENGGPHLRKVKVQVRKRASARTHVDRESAVSYAIVVPPRGVAMPPQLPPPSYLSEQPSSVVDPETIIDDISSTVIAKMDSLSMNPPKYHSTPLAPGGPSCSPTTTAYSSSAHYVTNSKQASVNDGDEDEKDYRIVLFNSGVARIDDRTYACVICQPAPRFTSINNALIHINTQKHRKR